MTRLMLTLCYLSMIASLFLSHAARLEANSSQSCFSCRIEVQSLDDALNLEGKWLFTREDRLENAQPGTSTQDWALAETPGPWSKIYNDGQNFSIGWYRGNFHFSEAMLGRKVVFYVDAYMSKMDVYLDGQRIFERSGQETHKKYYSIQPVPISFVVTNAVHVISIRVNTRLMTGIYQSPFQLRPYQDFDPFINFFQIFCGELRYLFAYIFAWTGGFFLILFARTRYPLYLISGLTGIGIFPFYAMPNDMMMKYFDPDILLVLHYPGIGFMALGYFFFSQFFSTTSRKTSIAYLAIIMAYAATFIYMTFDFHIGLFQIGRKTLFLVSFAIATHGVVNCIKGFKENRHLGVAILGQVIFWIASGHDILLAMGLIKSTSLIFVGTFCGIFSIMLITTQLFAETFLENKRLLRNVEMINAGLEKKVQERTLSLQEKSQEIASILDSLPEGVLEAGRDLKILANFSQAAAAILETKDIGGRDLFELVFSSCNLNTDTLAQTRAILEMSLNGSVYTFEGNRGNLPAEIVSHINGQKKVLSLGWSVISDQEDNVSKVLITLHDVTEQKTLEQESALLRLRARIIESVMQGSQSLLVSLIQDAYSKMSSLGSNLNWKELDSSSLYRELHTLKGNARTMELTELSNLCHLAETELAQFKQNPSKDTFVTVKASLSEVQSYLSSMVDIIASANKSITGQRWSEHPMLHPQLVQEIKYGLEKMKDSAPILTLFRALTFVKASQVSEGISESFRALSKSLGKAEAEFHQTFSDELLLDAGLSQSLRDMLGHLVRNSLDHGLEDAEIRKRQGKPAHGLITFELRLEAEGLLMCYRDDGAGLDLHVIREKGAQLGLCQSDEIVTERILDCIFHSGFTTARQLSMISGRGVGMDIIQFEMKRWQGQLRWVKHPERWDQVSRLPFHFTILFPAQLAYQLQPTLSVVA